MGDLLDAGQGRLIGDDQLRTRVSESHLEGVRTEEGRHRHGDSAQFVDGEMSDNGGRQLGQDDGDAIAE